MHIAATTPKSIDKEGLDKEIVAKEKIIFKEQLKDSGKPENILEKIIEGKIKILRRCLSTRANFCNGEQLKN